MRKHRRWLEAALFLILPALAYLPNISQFTFYRDDWYYIYDGIVLGPRAFLEMFEHLRPLRGPLFTGLFALFGPDPLPYHLLLFLWRVAGGAGMAWLLRLLWPDERQQPGAYWAALLFTVYPGFLWWVGGFEYQPMILSLGFQVFSIAFMLKAILAEKRAHKIYWTLASILSSWIYLGLVDYAIGMEFFRVLCAYVILSRADASPLASLRATFQRLLLSIRASLPALLGPLLFLAWRFFFFENWRPAADVSLQLGRVGDAPETLIAWAIRALQGVVNILFAAWAVPLHQSFESATLRAALVGWLVALTSFLLVILADKYLLIPQPGDPAKFRPAARPALTVGALGVLGALVPIITANRFVEFDRFSHYTLPASIAATVFLFGMWNLLSDGIPRRALTAALVLFAALTHSSLSARVADEARNLSQFWHQMAWRAPNIRAGTTLAVGYAGIYYAESADLVWGPANIIYYPQAGAETPIRIPLSAAPMEANLRKDALAGESVFENYIIINAFRYDYDNLLVISQPSLDSCVHVMDSRWPAFSAYENDTLVSIAGRSKIENIAASSEPPRLPETIFGAEPPHTWCYYYQKADLARQLGDWEAVTRVEAEAAQNGYEANDPIEWIPFVQARILQGDAAGLARIAKILKANENYKSDREYYRVQFCASIRALKAAGFSAPSGTNHAAENLFCR